MDGSWSPPAKRCGLRLSIELSVLIERAEARTHGYTVNIGFGGAFINGPERLAYEERVTLWIAVLGPGTLSRLPSVVRWSDDAGFGVQFLEVRAQDIHALTELMGWARARGRHASPGPG